MKPLYLQGKPGMSVDCEDSALIVTLPEKNPLLFPIARISRIVVTGTVTWSMTALFTCAEAGIVIVFFARKR